MLLSPLLLLLHFITFLFFLPLHYTIILGITFAALDEDIQPSVFHATPEEIKSYIKQKDSSQLILKSENSSNEGMHSQNSFLKRMILSRYAMQCVVLCCDGMGWDGMRCHGMSCRGMGWDVMRCDLM